MHAKDLVTVGLHPCYLNHSFSISTIGRTWILGVARSSSDTEFDQRIESSKSGGNWEHEADEITRGVW